MFTSRILLRGIIIASSKRSSVQHYSSGSPLCFKHALVVSKLSRYEFIKHEHPELKEDELEAFLKKRGSDYDMLLKHHCLHKEFEKNLQIALTNSGIETHIVNRFTLNEKSIQWADIVIAAGGDGTFLLAASRITGNEKPIIGFNSDPSRSEGHLCQPEEYSTNLQEAIKKLNKGKFHWRFRSRIRITLCGEGIFLPPIELHEQELLEPHHRYFDCVTEQQRQEAALKDPNIRVLPVLALNEVFIGENLSARVSYFEMCLDGEVRSKVKSSGLCVCTGTGSTSWNLSINRLTQQSVAEIMNLMGQEIKGDLVHTITEKFNDRLVFSPEDHRMCYTIRDLISAGVWPNPKGIEPRGFATSIEVRSCCFDGGLVVDGGLSFNFNDGTLAKLEIHESDALRTVFLDH